MVCEKAINSIVDSFTDCIWFIYYLIELVIKSQFDKYMLYLK